MNLRHWVTVLRAYRLALLERAVVADRCGRRCCALTLAGVRQDVTAAIDALQKSNKPD